MKILITGHGRHGKDTAAEYIKDKYNITYTTSSEFAMNNFIFDILSKKYGYLTKEECFNDRLDKRKEWYDLICDFCKDDKAKMAKEILLQYDCFVGQRDEDEFVASKSLYDYIIWVDASKRLPIEKTMTIDFEKHKGDMIILDNNKSKEYFFEQIDNIDFLKKINYAR